MGKRKLVLPKTFKEISPIDPNIVTDNWFKKGGYGYNTLHGPRNGLQSLIENVIIDHYEKYRSNVGERPSKKAFYDIIIGNKKVEIRCMDKKEKKITFGHTNGHIKRITHWTEKAEKLENGGYLIIHPYEEDDTTDKVSWRIFWIPAKFILKHRDVIPKCGVKSLRRLCEAFNIKFYKEK